MLPQINKTPRGIDTLVPLARMTGMTDTGMSGLRTGKSFGASRNEFTLRTGRVSPIRSASITALLSPKEMVQQFTRRGSQ